MVAKIEDSSTLRYHTALYVALRRQVSGAGLFDPAYVYYITQVAVWGSLLVASLAVVAFSSVVELRLAAAFAVAVFQTQVAYIAHDAGHRQVIPGHPLANDVVMMLLNPVEGIIPGWWNRAHNGHHSNPNDEERDPNYRVSILAFSASQLLAKSRLWQYLCRFQAKYYIPIVMLEPIAMHVQSIGYVSDGRNYYRKHGTVLRVGEAAGFISYFVAFFGFLIFLTPLPLRELLLFVAIHTAVRGLYLGAVFAPNHKGMRIIRRGENVSFLERQLATARNIRPGILADNLMGGLNYQIEHHVFPTVPRPRLRALRGIVKPFCEEHGLSYYETSFGGSAREIYQFFDTTGKGLPEAIAGR